MNPGSFPTDRVVWDAKSGTIEWAPRAFACTPSNGGSAAPDSLSFSHLNFINTEMANAHNAAVRDPELRVARSNLGTMDLHRIDLDAPWDELVALQELASRARTSTSPSSPISPGGKTSTYTTVSLFDSSEAGDAPTPGV